jgi:hypothetical protein
VLLRLLHTYIQKVMLSWEGHDARKQWYNELCVGKPSTHACLAAHKQVFNNIMKLWTVRLWHTTPLRFQNHQIQTSKQKDLSMYMVNPWEFPASYWHLQALRRIVGTGPGAILQPPLPSPVLAGKKMLQLLVRGKPVTVSTNWIKPAYIFN